VSTTPPTARGPWWRRRRTFVIVASVIVLFFVLSAINNRAAPTGGTGATLSDDQGNSAANATVVTAGTHSGTIAPAGDVDWFRVNVPAGTNIAAELRLGTLASGTISILSPSAQVLDDATEGSGKVARVSYQAKDAGSYLIRVRAGRPDATGSYSIVLTTR
jgi:hypothetical protein